MIKKRKLRGRKLYSVFKNLTSVFILDITQLNSRFIKKTRRENNLNRFNKNFKHDKLKRVC